MFLHGGDFLEAESERVYHEDGFPSVHPFLLVEFKRKDKQYEQYQEAAAQLSVLYLISRTLLT